MQDLLKDYLVEHMEDETMCFSLTCAVCGTIWRSTATSLSATRNHSLNIADAGEEAKEHNRMCTFCGRPVCLKCFENIEGIFLCTQCGQHLRERIDVK